MSEEKVKVVEYQVIVGVTFKVKRPEGAQKEVEKGLWLEMPANNIGENLFVKFPTQAYDYGIQIKAEAVPVVIEPAIVDVEAKVIEA